MDRQKFDKKISKKILPRFDSAKDWSDLMTIMKNLKDNLKKYSTSNMSKITDKVLLGKRLAQCLNPQLPHGLHEITLEIYDMIFDNIRQNETNIIGSDLGIYSSGLFPFFQYASSGNKTAYLNVMKKHYLEISDQELTLCLPGFLVSILPGLEDQNEQIHKLIKEIFGKARQKVGETNFFGVYWAVILRTTRVRLSGMKYLVEAIPSYKFYDEGNEETRRDYVRNFYPNIGVLVVNSMLSVIEDENVFVQRFAMDFLINHFPIGNQILNQDEKVALVRSALNLLIKNEYSTTRRLFSWLIGNPQEDDINTDDPTYKYMRDLLVEALKKVFMIKNITREKIASGIKIVDSLLKHQVGLVDYTLDNVSIHIIQAVKTFIYENNLNYTDDIVVKTQKFFKDYDNTYLNCLWSSLERMLSEVILKFEKIFDCITLLKFCLNNVCVEDNERKNTYYIPIISNLLKSLNNFEIRNLDNLYEIRTILDLILNFVSTLKEKNNISLKELLNKKYGFLNSFFDNIKSYQFLYIKICLIFLENTSNDISIPEMKIFQTTTELVLKLQEYLFQHNIPDWVLFLIKVCFSSNITFSLEGINYLLDILSVNSDNDVFQSIKLYLRSEEIDQEHYQNSFHSTMIQRNCCEHCMAKLWTLLEEPIYQKKIIDLLIKFYRVEPHMFSNTISSTFSINDLEQNVSAIRKFSQFWKLTSEFYPEIIFFEQGECIFKMLDFLDHEHPLLRHLSKSWLSQSIGNFNKILDPLIKVLLDKDTSWFISPKKKLYFAKEYDNRRIIEAFRKLKNIIINMTELAINYFINTHVSQQLIDLDETGKEISSYSRSIPIEHYLEIMVSISLRFIQGKFIESVSQSFHRENFSVNAASCEFLEFLLSFIEPKSKVMAIAELIAEPGSIVIKIVLMILYENIMNNDEVMQVQLLNLLKVLLFNTQNVHKEYAVQSVNIFNSQILHDCLNMGLQINYIFVRSHFISFVECCLPIFRDLLDQDSNLRIANKLIVTTSDFLVRRVKYYSNFFKIHHNKEINSDEMKFSHLHNKSFFAIKNYLGEYREIKNFDENDVNVIIKGLRQILFHFMSIENPIYNLEKINWTEFRKRLENKPTSSSFREYLGFLFGAKNFEENKEKKPISLISSEIYKFFDDVLASLMCCWANESDQYMGKDLCLCENGIMPYNTEEHKFQTNINDELNISIDKKNKNNKSIKLLKSQISNICMNIFISNPYEFMNCFLNLWLNEKHKYVHKDKQYKLSMIELLVNINIPTEVILISILKNINVSKIKELKKSKHKVKGNYCFYINRDIASYEAKICHLVYSYIILNNNLKIEKNIGDIWNEMINFMNIFLESKSPSTIFWVYEILNLMLIKLPVREANNKSLRNVLIDIVTKLFTTVVKISNNNYEILFEESTQIITPINPSVYELVALEVYSKNIVNVNSNLYQRYSLELKQKKDSQNNINHEESSSILITNSEDNIKVFYKSVFDNVISGTIIKNEDLLTIYRNIGFITLKNLFYNTMKNVYLPDKNDKLVIHIQTIVKNLFAIMNDKVALNKIYIDLATEFFHSLMINASFVVSNSCKTEIIEFFLESEFFNMPKKCIRLWRDIIKEFSHYNQDIIIEFLNKLNAPTHIFAKSNDNLKVKALRRLSFIIYSSPKDTYSAKLPIVLEKVKDVISSYSENPLLEAEIFLLIRVMFLRFSHDNLVEMLRHLWPIIFAELLNILSNKKKNSMIDLTLASLKLVELLSLANMEEFSLYQWIFTFDTFDSNYINSLVQAGTTKTFTPFVIEMIKNSIKINEIDEKMKKYDDYDKRGLIIEIQKLSNNDDMAKLVSSLVFYIVLMNNFRGKIDWDSIENVIESDFLNNIFC